MAPWVGDTTRATGIQGFHDRLAFHPSKMARGQKYSLLFKSPPEANLLHMNSPSGGTYGSGLHSLPNVRGGERVVAKVGNFWPIFPLGVLLVPTAVTLLP